MGARQPTHKFDHVVAVLFEGGLAPLALFLGWLLGQPALSTFAWRSEDAIVGVLAAFPMLGLFLIGQTWPVGPLRPLKPRRNGDHHWD